MSWGTQRFLGFAVSEVYTELERLPAQRKNTLTQARLGVCLRVAAPGVQGVDV